MLIQPQDTSFGTFFNLLNGYRLSRLLLEIRRSRIMEIIGIEGVPIATVENELDWEPSGVRRFVDVLCELGFLQRYDAFVCLSAFSRKFLIEAGVASQLRTLEFEERLFGNWIHLGEALQRGSRVPAADKTAEEQQVHLQLFLDAMHEAALVRADELWSMFPRTEPGTILEVGAGSGAYIGTFLEGNPEWQGIFCDLPDVVALAKKDKRLMKLRGRLEFVGCNILTDDSNVLQNSQADILLLSNLIHCQDGQSTGSILANTVKAVSDGGLVVIHDFFKDASWQGALYDFHMLVNTPTGRTYRQSDIASMLKSLGFFHTVSHDLVSFSTVLIAGKRASDLPELDKLQPLHRKAVELGFSQSVALNPKDVPVGQWVLHKCRTGCPNYTKKACCPPNSMEPAAMETLLGEFSSAILLVGEPPLERYQENLVELEKAAFQLGYHKALAFGSGPCAVCQECQPTDCLFPEKRRFALEACGVDVFGLAKRCGIELHTLKEKTDYVQYISMLLVE